MGKSQQNQSSNMAGANYDRAKQQGDQNQQYLQGQLPNATQQAQQTYGQASTAYNGMGGPTGAYDPATYETLSNQNAANIKTGGYNDAELDGQVKSNIGTNVKTGGYDPTQLAQLNKQYSDMTTGGLGGIDATQNQNLTTGYNKLINTGGLDDTTADAMRRQAASSSQGVYATMGANLARQQGAAGMGGAGGETAEMARHAAQDAATATTGANAQIGQIRQTGTIAGLGGLSGYEQGVAGGQRQALAGQSDLASRQASNVVTSTGQQADLAKSEAQGSLSAQSAQQELATGAAQQKIAAAGGLVNLYNSSPGYVNSLVQQIMQQQSITGTLTTEQAQIMAELGKEPGLLQQITSGIKNVASAGAAVAGLGA